MNRRHVVFFLAFLGAIVVPQLIGHGLNALYPPQPALVENEAVLAAGVRGFDDPRAVFGTSVQRDLTQDARAVYPEALKEAQTAQLGLTGTGASVVAARFTDGAAAERARIAFFKMIGRVSAEQDDSGTWRFSWPQTGQAAGVATAGRTFMLWMAPDAAALEHLRRESRALYTLPREGRTGMSGLVDAVRASPPGPLLAAIGVYALFVSWLFLRLVGWATEVAANPGIEPMRRSPLRQRLLDVTYAASPIAAAADARSDRVVVDWKYADAKWLDHARAHGMRKAHRLILQLDETDRTVRCREFHSETDWSAGASGATLRWKSAWEIVFFQYEHERVFGLQVGADGNLVANLSYAYTFDIREMKYPLIAAVTAAGWRWRQVFFFAPSWLRWLHD